MIEPSEFCPEPILLRLAKTASDDSRKGLKRLEELLKTYPSDARLHFLRGSLFAALRQYPEAVSPMRKAIDLAPDFHIARFQLGLLHLSSGNPEAAREVWGALGSLDQSDALRLFAEGLQHMAVDQFEDAKRLIRAGIAQNLEHPAINVDMQLVLDRLEEEAGPPQHGAASSETHWLLNIATSRKTKH